ncbi:hypothetical protein HHK36_009768 [Tetracentron sinense]|uniref:Pentatricopeptide repeat-containing protein n=1 Tax=Tetracentron sinense TaxID=13715 RepID=A0A834ZGQ0_TETSI|nr:hypothetical protein HHK36_009768 [Tetracentron sinense]
MEASSGAPRIPTPSFEPNAEKIKRKLLQHGVFPTPKIIHTLRKKEIQKSNRKLKRIADKTLDKPLSDSITTAEEAHFQTLACEYRGVMKEFKAKTGDKNGVLMVGKPWERVERVGLKELANSSKEYSGEKLKGEQLEELGEFLTQRNRDDFRWLLDDDIEAGGCLEIESERRFPAKRRGGDADAIRFLIDRLSATDLSMRDWKFSRLMNQSGLQFTEEHMLKIIEGLGALGNWRHSLSVVEWVYNCKDRKHHKSRFVYTKLLAVLGKARRPSEALQIFNLMREDCHIYPDLPAYRSIAVTLGQAGLLKELLNIIERMRQKPTKRTKNVHRKNWDPCLEPDVVVFNAVLNACVPSHQWKGVSWVLEQLRKNGLKPNGATYGLAMEVMLQSGKYDLVHKFFGKMRRSGEGPKSLTYKVLVRAFWEEGKVNEAVEAVRDMERRGVVGTASVYYELACCLCNNGRWQEAMVEAENREFPSCFYVEVEKLKKLSLTKPLEVAFTGMIISSMDGGHVANCISIFEYMKDHCAPNIGTITAMLKVYGRNDMFAKAKGLFEETKRTKSGCDTYLDGGGISLTPDWYTYCSILEASASAYQWEYFEYVYKEMTVCGYQLDHNKHASLLVKASRAGKWHLLEHAFDSILEAGEIPHLSIFTEMVCQATAQHNYERAVILVNSMAHAPFQVTEKQWTDLFRRNGDRISREGLEKLLNTLGNSDVAKEATVSNLSRSLHSLCGSSASKDSLGHIAFSDVTTDKLLSHSSEGESDINKSVKIQNRSIDMENGNPNPIKNLPDIDSGGISVDCFDDRNSVPIAIENSQDATTDMAMDMLANRVGDSNRSELPSASEILKAWKKSREKDGIFFPFQIGRE